MKTIECVGTIKTEDGVSSRTFKVSVPDDATDKDIKKAVMNACKVTVSFREANDEFRRIRLR